MAGAVTRPAPRAAGPAPPPAASWSDHMDEMNERFNGWPAR